MPIPSIAALVLVFAPQQGIKAASAARIMMMAVTSCTGCAFVVPESTWALSSMRSVVALVSSPVIDVVEAVRDVAVEVAVNVEDVVTVDVMVIDVPVVVNVVVDVMLVVVVVVRSTRSMTTPSSRKSVL